MNNITANDITVYIALIFGIILLIQIDNKIPPKPYIKPSAKVIIKFLASVLIASGVIYWQIRNTAPQILSFDAWILGLDISLAHVIVTVPVFQELFYLFKWLLGWIYFIVIESTQRLEKSRYYIIGCFSQFIKPISAYLIPALLTWVLLVRTKALQLIIFGVYDSRLGWHVPTTYKFTILFEHLKNIFGGNSVLATIVAFIAFSISLILGLASTLNAIKNIGESIESKD